MCPICLAESESIEHLLCGCAWTKAVWFGSDLSLTFKDEVTSISRWMCNLYSAFSNTKERRYFFSKLLCMGWHIWKSRNALVFNRLPVDSQSTIFLAARDNLEFLSAALRHSFKGSLNHTPVDTANVVWTTPSSGCFKANCDVAMEKGSTKASIAVLFRNWKGELVDGAVQRIEVQSVLQGEAFAVRKACLIARALNLSQVEIEGDNKSVISLCVSEDVPPWTCAPIIEDIRTLARCSNFSLHWSPRSANGATHWTARASLSGALPANWVINPPLPLVRALG